MKMENDITATVSGTVKEIAVSEGSDTSTGQLLMTIG
jgi:biotin carboxyl carrier protein